MRFVAGEADAGRRVDVAVAERTGAPRTAVQVALRSGRITVDGVKVKAGHRLSPGDVIAGEDVVSSPEGPAPEAIPVDVCYDDGRVMVVSKPPGLVVHPAGGHPQGTLVNALLALDGPLSRVDPARPGIVHRLDRDTSGLLLVARDDDAHRALALAIKERRVVREYRALVRGVPAPPSGTVDAPIGRHPRRRTVMAVIPGGRRAVTHYRTRADSGAEALLDVRLETGRTHQIRVHLAHLGHPVLGDRTYGGMTERARDLGLVRPFLHAAALEFPHPDDGREVRIEDVLPDDLATALALTGMDIPS